MMPKVEQFCSASRDNYPESYRGFDFLGMNIRKYNGKLIIKPAKGNVKRFLASIRESTKHYKTIKTEELIRILNPKIRGWSNYYRHVCSKKTFGYVDHKIFKTIWRWCVRRHPDKGKIWVKSKYFRSDKLRNWVFSTKVRDKCGNSSYLDLYTVNKVPIIRHAKIRADAIPYDKIYHDYFDRLIAKRKIISRSTTKPKWWMCWWNLFKPLKKPGKSGSPTAAL